MGDFWLHLTTVFFGFFAIMNPVTNTSMFVALTSDFEPAIRRRVAIRSVIIAMVLVSVFCLAGNQLFHLFGITLPAFRIMGGILAFLIGFHMLEGSPSKYHSPTDKDMEAQRESELETAMTPLAMPILAGPGTIATAMNFAVGDSTKVIVTLSVFALMLLITLVMFLGGIRIMKFIKPGIISMICKIMGLILAVIGVQMLLEGVASAYHLHLS